MPVQSKTQFKYIWYLRNKYKDKKTTPDNLKWIWDDEWINVNYDNLPQKKEMFTNLKKYKQSIILFDLDNTLVKTKAKIKVIKDGKETFITPSQYTNFKKEGHVFDFSDFEDDDILQNGLLIETIQVLKQNQKKRVGILTARSNKEIIQKFLKNNDIQLLSKYIFTVTEDDFIEKYNTYSVPLLKRYQVEELIKDGYNDITIYDDDAHNLSSIKKLVEIYDVTLHLKHVSFSTNTINEYLTDKEIQQIEYSADKYFNKLGLDLEFTKHFKERINDPRNRDSITYNELDAIFKEIYQKYGLKIREFKDQFQAVFKDMTTDINTPFVIVYNNKSNEIDLIMKTIMRKKDFKTPNPTYHLKSMVESKTYKVSKIQNEINQIAGVKTTLLETDYSLEITFIGIEPSKRGSGLMRQIMSKIIEYAKTNNLIINLYPSDEYGVEKNKLIEMYQHYGFVSNRKIKDSRFDKDDMLKLPI